MLCGAKGWKAINIFGEAQLDWLKEYENFSLGIPTRHYVWRIIRGIKADSLVSCFINFSNAVRESNGKEHISFDGKVVCGSKHGERNALQLMTTMVVREGKGDYVLQVKNNQGKWLKEIEAYFYIAERDFPKVLKDNFFQALDGEHGLINEREYRLLPITEWFDETEKFKDSLIR